jgi:YVTN family beta-propeller protein
VVSRDGSRVYVTTGRGGTLVSVDPAARRIVGSAAVGPRPWGVALSADGRRLYTANGPSGDVTVVDAATLAVLRRIPVGKMPWGVAAGPR